MLKYEMYKYVEILCFSMPARILIFQLRLVVLHSIYFIFKVILSCIEKPENSFNAITTQEFNLSKGKGVKGKFIIDNVNKVM